MNPDSIIAVILGASKWPNYKDLADSDSLLNSAAEFHKYLASSKGLRLPAKNILNLFNSRSSPSELLYELGQFIEEHGQKSNITDLL
jgi:hypothetical protein